MQNDPLKVKSKRSEYQTLGDVMKNRREKKGQSDLDYLMNQIGTIDESLKKEIKAIYEWSHLFNELDRQPDS